MPILGDHLQEIDKTYTPLEAKRRESMRLRNVGYGFFTVPSGPTERPKCACCGHAAEKFVIICGVRQCEPCFNARR